MTYSRQLRSFERSQFFVLSSTVNVLIFDDMEQRPPPSFNPGRRTVYVFLTGKHKHFLQVPTQIKA